MTMMKSEQHPFLSDRAVDLAGRIARGGAMVLLVCVRGTLWPPSLPTPPATAAVAAVAIVMAVVARRPVCVFTRKHASTTPQDVGHWSLVSP
jgi:hypothetical protein